MKLRKLIQTTLTCSAVLVSLHCSAQQVFAQNIFGGVFKFLGGEDVAPAPEPVAEAAVLEAWPPIDGMVDQYKPVLRRILATELRYLCKICEPNQEQLKLIRAAGLKELNVIAARIAQVEQSGTFPRQYPNVRQLFASALEKSVTEAISPESAARYNQEISARMEARKESIIGMMSAIVDRRVQLAPEQFDEVVKAIGRHWQQHWITNMTLFTYEEYAPVPAASAFDGVFTPQQKQLWNSRVNHGGISFGWEQDLGGIQFNLEPHLADDDILKDPPEQQEKPAATPPAQQQAVAEEATQ